jgi:tyrosine aminotransferase
MPPTPPPLPAILAKKPRLLDSSCVNGNALEQERLETSPQRRKDGPQRAFECRNLIRETVGELNLQYGPATLDLSVGDPTKFGGTFSVPKPLREAIVNVIESGKYDGYGPAIGDESCRKALALRYNVDFNRVAITSGCSMAIDISLRSLAGEDDIVLVPVPGFPLYETLLKLNGVSYVRYQLNSDNDWKVDIDSFAHIVPVVDRSRVKAIIVCNPSNPTGSVYEEVHLREILVKSKLLFPNAVVIADQVYEDVIFDNESRFIDMGPLGIDLQVPVVSVSGLAKGFHAPGWRMGWIISYDAPGFDLTRFRKGVQNISNTNMGASTIIQHAVRLVLTSEKAQAEMRTFRSTTDEALRTSTAVFMKGLNEIEGMQVAKPKGAMYIFFKFPGSGNSKDLCIQLLKSEGLLLLPGDACFGSPPGFVRALVAIPVDVAQDAVTRITRFCELSLHASSLSRSND